MCTFIFYDDMAGRCSQWFLGFTGGKLTHIYWTRFSGCCCDAGGTDRRFGHFTWALYVLQDRIRVWLLCAVFSKAVDFFFSLSTELCTQMDQKWIKTFPTSLFDHFFLSLLQFSYFIFLSDFSKLIDYTCTHYDHTLTHTHTTQTHTHTELPREQVWLV